MRSLFFIFSTAPKPTGPRKASGRMAMMAQSISKEKEEKKQEAEEEQDGFNEEAILPPIPVKMPEKRRGSGADWIANKAGRLKEFEAVQKSMQLAMKQMSTEQLEERNKASIKIQAMARARSTRHSVKTLRAQRLQEENAKKHLLAMKNSPKNSKGNGPR